MNITKENWSETSTASRRRLLKMTGTGVAALAAIPVAGSAQTDQETSDSETIIRFLKEVASTDSKREAKPLWESLSREEAEAVSHYIENNSYTTVETINQGPVEDRTGADFEGRNTEMIPNDLPIQTYSHTERVRRTTASVTLYTMTHRMVWRYDPNNRNVNPVSNSSSGSGDMPYWSDITETSSSFNGYDSTVVSRKRRKFEHDPPGVAANTYSARIDLRGYEDGNSTVITKSA